MTDGIPPFDIIMIVEFQWFSKKELDEAQFALSFGGLPKAVEMRISAMLHSTQDARRALFREDKIPVDASSSSSSGRTGLQRRMEDEDDMFAGRDIPEKILRDNEEYFVYPCRPFPIIPEWTKGTDDRQKSHNIPDDVFLDSHVVVSEYERRKIYSEDDVMKCFVKQDHFIQQSIRAKKMIIMERDVRQKFFYRIDYIRGSMRLLHSTIMNGSMRSKQIYHSTRYLKTAGEYCCYGMKQLMSEVCILFF